MSKLDEQFIEKWARKLQELSYTSAQEGGSIDYSGGYTIELDDAKKLIRQIIEEIIVAEKS